jgi:hypothetical protein
MDERATNLKNQTDALRAEIEKARAETSETLNEIQKRLSVDRARNIIRNATKGRAQDMTRKASEITKNWGASVWEMVKDNPIPTAMVGTGIAWMIKNQTAGDSEPEYKLTEEEFYRMYPEESLEEAPVGDIHYRPYQPEEYGETSRQASERIQEGKHKVKEAREKGRQRARETAEQAGRRAEELKRSARSGFERVSGRARERAYVVRSAAERARYRAREQGRRVKQGFFHTMEENPLTFAGAVFALGAVVGLAVPEARKEREVLVPKKDELLERAEETGREQVEKVKAVAEEAKQAAKDEAQKQGLASRETVEQAEQKAKQSAQETKHKV